jgi:phage-related protein
VKRLRWLGSSYKRLCDFPKIAIRQAGYQLGKVQQGLEPTDWKPMPSIGPGAVEIRIHDPHEHRVVYVAKFADAVYVLHAFEKKTQKTAEKDLDIARTAYAELKKNEAENG